MFSRSVPAVLEYEVNMVTDANDFGMRYDQEYTRNPPQTRGESVRPVF